METTTEGSCERTVKYHKQSTGNSPETYLFVLSWSLAHLGGVNQVVINLARQMKTSGSFEPIILICDWNAASPVWEEIHGLRTLRWRIRPFEANMKSKERLAYIVWELRFCREFQKFCRKHRVAVINPHFPGAFVFTLERVIKDFEPGIPLIVSFHGADLSGIASASPIELKQWQQCLHRVEGIVVCSSDFGKKVENIFGKKVVSQVIHNGLDTEAFIAMADKPPSDKTRNKYILSVAKFEEKKGLDILIKAFATIADDYNDVDLVLVGASAEALGPLQELCSRKGVAGKVHFFPDTEHHQVAGFFSYATIFVLPSRQEPFGIVLLEAGAFSLPVIASCIGGIPEIVTEGITGKLVPPENSAKLAACMRSLLDSPEIAKEMGERLHQHVLENFTWVMAHNKYVALAINAQQKMTADYRLTAK